MYLLLLYIGLSVFVLLDFRCHCVFISKNESVKIQAHPQTHGMGEPELNIQENNEQSSRLAYTHVIRSQRDDLANRLQHTGKANTTSLLRDNTDDEVLQPNPCSVQNCATDTIVNCMGMALMDIRSTWFPKNTTAIFLDYNNIKTVDNVSFSSLTHLRILSLSNNRIKHVQENAFKDLMNLEYLNLQWNHLNQRAFPGGIFDPLCRVKSLFISKNKQTDNVPGSLFRKLHSLTILSVDAAGETFSLGKVKGNLTKLIVTGNVKFIDYTSFLCFPHIRELIVVEIDSLSNFTDTALQPLQNLDILRVSGVHIGVEKSLQTLKPLTGTNMTSISFQRVYFDSHEAYLSLYNNQGILNAEKTQYLTKICVAHFSITNSRIYVIQMNTFNSKVLKACLRSLDLSSNNLVGTKHAIASLLFFHHIEVLILENEMRPCYIKDSFAKDNRQDAPLFTTQTTCNSHESLAHLGTVSGGTKMDGTLMKEMLQHHYLHEKKVLTDGSINYPDVLFESEASSQCPSAIPSREHNLLGYLRVYASKSMTYLKARGLISSGDLRMNMIFVGGSSLRIVDLRDSGIKHFIGNIIGLNRLQTLMLSGNDVSDLSKTFFDGMCHLAELDLSNCHLDAHFMTNYSARIFQKLLDLKRVDLSSNLLNDFEPGTFASNHLLEEIDLSKNRFRNIPFNLRNTPQLKLVDLRDNSLTTLTSRERDAIDSLATQPAGFRLLISGNILSCGCNNFRFLIWLHTTSASLDDGRNFTCMNDEGQLSYISDVTDLDVLWRKCWGKTFLSLSLILLCCKSVGFLLIFCIWKNKTFITSKILQILTGYKLKSPEDYHIGVFIGYSETDYNFPCLVLCKFIQEELNLTTYVYNRDSIPGCDRARSIVDAINSSWRIVLVATSKFLDNDDWAMFTTRTAIYGLSPANPARVVVLVQENLQHRLPQEVLCSVPEVNILLVSSWKMTDDLDRKLRICLKNYNS